MENITNKIKIVIGVILFSLIPIVIKRYNEVNISSLSFMRVLITSIFIFLIWHKRKLINLKTLKIKHILFGIFHGATILSSFYAIEKLSVTLATLLLYLGNIYLFIFIKIKDREMFKLKEIIAISFSFIGMFIIFYDKTLLNNLTFFSLFVSISSGIFYALSFLYARIISKKESGINLTFTQNFIATIILIPFIFSQGIQFSNNDIIAYLIIGIFLTAIPFILIYSSIKKMNGNQITNILALNIPLPIIFAAIFINEKINSNQIIGTILIILTSIYTLRDNRNQRINKKIN
jgi:drug/metabolite transporter (DMT)-like permease